MTSELTCYDADAVDFFHFYLQHSSEHQAMAQVMHKVLPQEFQRIGKDKMKLEVLGVGSGGGEMDAQILSIFQTVFPEMPLTADIVEGSSPLVDNFKALVAKSPNLQKIPFAWHVMRSEAYEKQEKAKADMKKFDFIHLIQMIYHVEDLDETIRFFHSLLKDNGRLMIILEIANGGWDILWKTFKKELWVGAMKEYRSSTEVIAALERQGLKYDEHVIPNHFDVSMCFDPNDAAGQRLLSFMTQTNDFSQSFTPEIRASMLDLIRSKCTTKESGKMLFNSTLSCILIHA